MSNVPRPSSVLAAVRDLHDLGGYGTVEYQIDQHRNLVHTRTIATARPETPAERADLTAFLARLRHDHDVQPGDMIELRYDNGALVLATITRYVP